MYDPAKHIIHLVDGRLAPKSTTTAQNVTDIVRSAVAAKMPSGIVIHFHGGLVSEKSARETAEQRLYPLYEAQGHAYPIFFVWESGFLEAPWNNLKEIVREVIFQQFVKKVSEWVLKSLPSAIGFRGGGGATVDEAQLRADFDAWFSGQRDTPPQQLEKQPGATDATIAARTKGAAIDEDETLAKIEESIDGDEDFKAALQEVYNGLDKGGTAVTKGMGTTVAVTSLISKEAAAELFPKGTPTTKGFGPISWFNVAKAVATIVFRVISRLRSGRGHGGYVTVVEEVMRQLYVDKIGRQGWWDRMKGDTADAFKTGPEYGGTAFLTALHTELAAANPVPTITLVGHSTGAVYICHLLKAAAHLAPNLRFDVILEAPAATHDLFAATIEEHGSRIRNLRQFGMSDEREAHDVLVPVLYVSSLLYFVSGLLETESDEPLIGMARYVQNAQVYEPGIFPSVEACRKFYARHPNSLQWSPSSGGAGLNSDGSKHGDFDDQDAKTMASVAYILQNGF